MREWLLLAADRAIIRRGLMYSAIVGTILIGVNHGDALLNGDVSWMRVVKIIVTMMIPYGVSTASSVGAMQSARREHQQASANRP